MQPFKYNPNYNSGSFRHRITFQSYDPDAVNENGFPLPEEMRWADYKTVWAMIKTVQGREYYQAASTQNENTIRFVIRYLPGLNADMRITYKSRTFQIQSIINDDEANKTFTIMCKEAV